MKKQTVRTRKSKTPRARTERPAPAPFATRAIALLATSDSAADYGTILLIANDHLDDLFATDDRHHYQPASLSRLIAVIEAMNCAREKTYDHDGPRYSEIRTTLQNSDIRIPIGKHDDQPLCDVTSSLEYGAVEAGFALGMALGLRMSGGAR